MRVPAKPLRQYPWYLRPFYWGQRRKYGHLLEPTLLWGRSPWLFLGVAMLIAFQNMPSKFNAALDVPSQRFCQLPVESVG